MVNPNFYFSIKDKHLFNKDRFNIMKCSFKWVFVCVYDEEEDVDDDCMKNSWIKILIKKKG